MDAKYLATFFFPSPNGMYGRNGGIRSQKCSDGVLRFQLSKWHKEKNDFFFCHYSTFHTLSHQPLLGKWTQEPWYLYFLRNTFLENALFSFFCTLTWSRKQPWVLTCNIICILPTHTPHTHTHSFCLPSLKRKHAARAKAWRVCLVVLVHLVNRILVKSWLVSTSLGL